MYFKIETNAGGFQTEEFIKAENIEQAKAIFKQIVTDLKVGEPDDPIRDEDIQTDIEEVSIEECIAEEEKTWKYTMQRMYIRLHCNFDIISVREYSDLQKKLKNNPEWEWLMKKDMNTLVRQLNFLRKTCDTYKMPTEDFLKSL